jgi:hypothetical protein
MFSNIQNLISVFIMRHKKCYTKADGDQIAPSAKGRQPAGRDPLPDLLLRINTDGQSYGIRTHVLGLKKHNHKNANINEKC